MNLLRVIGHFLRPEASKFFDAYVRTRKLNGEHIDQESYLFATKQNARTRKNDYLSQESIYRFLIHLYKKAGITRIKKGNRFDLAVTYGFRKRFNGMLKMDNSINSNIAEKLMAHKLGLDGTYLQPTRDECYREFVKAISQLTIDPTERLKLENEKKQEKIDQLEAKTLEVIEKTKINTELEERVKQLERMWIESKHPKIKL